MVPCAAVDGAVAPSVASAHPRPGVTVVHSLLPLTTRMAVELVDQSLLVNCNL